MTPAPSDTLTAPDQVCNAASFDILANVMDRAPRLTRPPAARRVLGLLPPLWRRAFFLGAV